MKLFSSKKHAHSTIPREVQSPWHGVGRDPYVDWPVIFAVSTIVTIVLVCVSTLVYVNVGRTLAEPVSAAPVAPRAISATADLDHILHEFDGRASTTLQVENGYVGSADPSR